MSGHSHWHNIQLKKGKADARRAGAFSKLVKNITVAAREGGDVAFNFKLRMAVDAAKGMSVPKENIDRAIARGSGNGEDGVIEEVVYEGFAPGGVAMLVVCLTDNRNRSVAEVKTAATKNGGVIGVSGSVMWMFEKKGIVRSSTADEMALIDAGAEDIVKVDPSFAPTGASEDRRDVYYEIVCEVKDLQKVAAAAGKIEGAQIAYIAKTTTDVDESKRAELEAFLEIMEDLDDVDSVYTNEA